MPDATYQAYRELVEQLDPVLRESCEPRDTDIFLLRFQRYFHDMYEPLAKLYGMRPDFPEHLKALCDLMIESYVNRPNALRLLDIERHMTLDWFLSETMLGYVCYTEMYAETLQGVIDNVDYLTDLGVTYLHLIPVLKPRPGISDGGYAVQDYREVDPSLGNIEDLARLADSLHENGISLCVDLVLNHTAKEHEWAQRAMAGDPAYLDYYFTFDNRTMPDAYERTLKEVFPQFAPGNFTWYPDMAGTGKWVWTTFNSFQWDLNYRNPSVFREMTDIMMYLANRGVDILRLDAVPFIWKNLGTDCENQPEVHLLVQAFRAIMRIVAPSVIFKAEAIVSSDKLVPYLGVGMATRKECELAYHNQLMVLLWSTLATRQVKLMTHALHKMPDTPPGTTWMTYVRNHDDIGWAIQDEDAGEIGVNGFLHRQFLTEFYSGDFTGSFAQGARFQFNPVTQDARISGSAASLAGIERALQSENLYELELAKRRILLVHSVIMAFGGIPLIYMGDELGLLNDMRFATHPIRYSDNRWMHRPPMDWDKAKERYNPYQISGLIYMGIKKLVNARAATPVLNSTAKTQPMWTDSEHVFALARKHPSGNLLLLANFHETTQHVSADLIQYAGLKEPLLNVIDPTCERARPVNGRIYLDGYETMWLIDQ